jgi:hypothetical protein
MPLSDEESIDRVNPFVQHDFFMPGTSRQIIDFAKHTPQREEPEQAPYVSPACDYGVMIAGRIGKTGDCPLSRDLLPGRNIQYDEPMNLVNKPRNLVDEEARKRMVNNLISVAILSLLIVAL